MEKLMKSKKNEFSATTLRVILIVILAVSNGVFLGVAYTIQNRLKGINDYRQQATPINKKDYVEARKNDLIALGSAKLPILAAFYKAPGHQENISRDLHKLAELSHLKITNIRFPEEPANSLLTVGPTSSLFGKYQKQIIDIDIAENSPIESYFSFIKLIEKSLPLLIPENIDISLDHNQKIIYAPLRVGALVDYENIK